MPNDRGRGPSWSFVGAKFYHPCRLELAHWCRSTGAFASRLVLTPQGVEISTFIPALQPPVRIPLPELRKVEAVRSRVPLPWHRYGVWLYWGGDADLAFMTRQSSQRQLIAALQRLGAEVIDGGDRWFF